MISILYVDDDLSLLDIGKRFLEREGEFQVELRDSATRALNLLRSSHYDIIISDYEMPGMNGLVFLQNVRARFGEIPFILFTGRGREDVVIQALNDGADYYLQKGGDPKPQFAELIHKVKLAVQRRNINLELKESERRYREVVETQSEFISRFTPDGTTVFANEAYFRYFGKTREEVIGHRFIPDIPETDRKMITSHFSSLTKDHPVGEVEHRIRMPDGSIRWHQWRDHAIFDETGTLVEYQSLGKDITDRKKVEEELEQSENLYRTIFENTGAATIIYGDDKTIFHANAEFTRMSGYTLEELEGKKNWTEFIVREDLDQMDQYHQIRSEGPARAPQSYEFRFIDRNGCIRYCINHVSLIPGTTRRVASVVDITERVMVEQEYRNIFENIQDIFYRTDISENLILASPSGAKILEYESAAEMYGKKIADTLYFNPEDWVKFLEEIEKSGSVSNYEMVLKNRTGKPMTMIASSHKYYDAAGNYQGIEGILRDISDRKKVEEALQTSETLYRAVFENTGAASIIIAPDTIILLANSGWEKLTGVSRVDQENKLSWTRFIDTHDVERMKQYHHLRRQDPSLAPTVYECRVIHADTLVRHCIVHVDIIPGSENSVAPLVDITDRKRFEDELQAANEELVATQEEMEAQFEELKSNQKKIRESEEKYRRILDTMQDVYYRTDKEGKTQFTSPSASTVLGYPVISDIYGKNIADTLYFNPEDRGPFLAEIEKTGSLINYEVVLRKHDNTPITVITSSHKYYDSDGTYQGIEGIFRDISERKLVEEQLKQSEDLYRAVFENTGAASIIIAPDTIILLANSGWEKLTGVSRVDQENKLSWTRFIDTHDVERMKQYHHLRRQDPSLAPTVYECRVIHADTSVRYCIVNVDIIPGSENSVASLVDITDRKRFEDELQAANEELVATQEEMEAQFEELKSNQKKILESEEQYRRILDTMQDVYYQTDKDGNTLFTSPSVSTVLGYLNVSDLYGKNIAHTLFLNPDDRKILLAEMEKTGSISNYEFLLRKKDGTPISVITSSHKSYDSDGIFQGIEGIFRDITERKQIENLYLAIFEKMGIPMVILEEDMTISQVNTEFENTLGYSRTEIEGIMKWPSLITQDERDQMVQLHTMRTKYADDIPITYEFRCIQKNGDIYDASFMVIRIPGTQKCLISIRNIADLKATQIALHKTEEVMEHLLAQLPDYVIIHEGERITFVNEEGARLMGKTPEEIVGTSVLSFASPEYHELLRKNILLRYQGIDLKPYAIEIIAPSGERRWLEVRSTSLKSRKKDTTLAVLTDITDRKNAEEALKASESKYRAIIENMQDLVYQADLQGNLTMISPGGAGIAGYSSPEELIGHNLATEIYSDPHEREHFLALLQKDGVVTDYPITLVDKRGDIHHVTASSHYYSDNQGNVVGIEGIIHDITEKKRAEDAVLQANRKLNLLTNITRHDINNQLVSLLGYLSILDESLKGSPALEYSRKAVSVAERINAIIQFTQQYEEIGVKAPVWQNIRKLVEDASQQAHLGTVILKNDIPKDVEVFADPLFIKILYNLIENAIRYGDTISSIRFFTDDHYDELRIICEDDGAGIPVDDKEKIFEKGFGKNTGLGLALCREILSITGILIDETGEPGKGARFEIIVPGNGWRI